MSTPVTVRANPVQARPETLALLERLHAASLEEESSLDFTKAKDDGQFHDQMRDKFVALDQDKCWFVYQMILAKGARSVLEIGTSFGVSTIYLALAVQSNLKLLGGQGTVIATEYEPSKAAMARAHWREAGEGISEVIDLREGDLRDTLPAKLPALDLVLLDIWAPMALPALQIAEPHLKPGAIVICDNSIASAHRYKDLQAYMRAPGSGYTNLTIPYTKGLELSVWVGKS